MIFAIPATSAPSERLFSEAGLIVKHSRTLLNSDRVEELVYIHENYPRVQPLIKKWKFSLKEFRDEENSHSQTVKDPGDAKETWEEPETGLESDSEEPTAGSFSPLSNPGRSICEDDEFDTTN